MNSHQLSMLNCVFVSFFCFDKVYCVSVKSLLVCCVLAVCVVLWQCVLCFGSMCCVLAVPGCVLAVCVVFWLCVLCFVLVGHRIYQNICWMSYFYD